MDLIIVPSEHSKAGFVQSVYDKLQKAQDGQQQKVGELKLEKPIVFFDLETTGVQITKDRIVEISILKVFPNGNKESKTWLVNPTIPIPEETTAIPVSYTHLTLPTILLV